MLIGSFVPDPIVIAGAAGRLNPNSCGGDLGIVFEPRTMDSNRVMVAGGSLIVSRMQRTRETSRWRREEAEER